MVFSSAEITWRYLLFILSSLCSFGEVYVWLDTAWSPWLNISTTNVLQSFLRADCVVVPCKPWWEKHLFPFVCLTQIAWTWYNTCVNTNTTMLIQSSAPKTTITGPSVSLPVPIACTEKTSSAQITGARLSTCLVLYEGGLQMCLAVDFEQVKTLQS